jgi:DNA-binding NarL/FixJ family response regulator
MAECRVLLVDDHVLVRESLRERLEREPCIVVVDTTGDAEAAIELAERHRPDLIVMDIDMPGLSCFEAARQIVARQPDVRLIFLSAHMHDHYIEQALKVGALGYLTKGESADKVVAAISAAMRNEGTFSAEVSARLVITADRATLTRVAVTRLSMLSARELETLRYIARGFPHKEIAGLMHVGQRTVAKHTENLMRKLAIHDRVELARFAIREGLAEP